MTATFYDVLGVGPDASQAEVREAYREKVKEYHPDVSDHPDAESRFRAVVRAEEVLGDPDERVRYDRLGHDSYCRVVGEPDATDWPTAEEVRADEADVGPGTDGPDAGAGPDTGGPAGERTGGTDWWREAWEPGTGEDNWRQTADPERRSYSVGGSTADRSAGPGAAGASEAGTVERERKRRQSTVREDDSFWSAEVDEPIDASQPRGGVARKIRSRDAVVLSTVLLVIYPIAVYFSISPTLSPTLRVLLTLATVGMAVLSLVEPAVSAVVFGTWSVLSPLVLVFLGQPLSSIVALLVLVAFWVPLVLTGLVMLALPGR